MPTKLNYDWTRFFLRIEIDVPPEKVFKAWTDSKMICRWFAVNAVIVPETKGRIYLEWLAGDKADEEIIDIVKNRRLVIPFGTKGEEVDVRIKKDGKGSICELRQYNMKTTPKDKIMMHMGCKSGWVFFLTNLKAFLEYGIDLRSHDPKRSYKQNFVNS